MADPNIRGNFIPLAWGTSTATGYVAESDNDTTTTEDFTIDDEVGNVVTQITGFGVKTDKTLEVIPSSTITTPPAVGEIFTYATKKITIISIAKKRIKKDVEKWTISGNRYEGVPLA